MDAAEEAKGERERRGEGDVAGDTDDDIDKHALPEGDSVALADRDTLTEGEAELHADGVRTLDVLLEEVTDTDNVRSLDSLAVAVAFPDDVS